MKKVALLIVLTLLCAVQSFAQTEDLKRWQQQAGNVTITRDTWGIAHVHGKTDADAVFGMIYALRLTTLTQWAGWLKRKAKERFGAICG